QHLLDLRPQALSRFAIADLAADADAVSGGHEHQKSPGERNLRRDAWAFRRDGLFRDLDDQRLAALEHVLDGRSRGALPAATAARLLRLAFVRLVVGVLVLFVIRLDEIRRVEKRALLRPYVDEGGLDSRKYCFDSPQ